MKAESVLQTSLFDELHRTDRAVKRRLQPSFRYLNESARATFRRIREVLDSWYSHYPLVHRGDLRSRFRSDDPLQHAGAFFELLCHELLLRLGCSVEVHPDIPGASGRPDFRATGSAGRQFYLESAVIGEPAGFRDIRELDRVLDAIDEVKSRYFLLAAEAKGRPAGEPALGPIRARVQEWLSNLDYASVLELEVSDWNALPRLTIPFEGWSVELRALPRRRPRLRPDRRLIGIDPSKGGGINTAGAIRRVLKMKRNQLGSLDAPAIIAVNPLLGGIDNEMMYEALIGPTVVRFLRRDGHPVGEPWVEREIDGAFVTRRGPQLTGLAGVLVFDAVFPWTFGRPTRLWINPWAQHGPPDELLSLPRAVPGDTSFDIEEGRSPREILGIRSGWPERG